MYAIIGILFLTKCVSSLNLNCTRLTTACPTAAQWSARDNSFNCSGHKSYVCLMASNAELREGCIFEVMILAGHTGCPCTKQCDDWTGQPLLVTENNYLPCPPDLIGCPPRNHSGYSILEIYKYPRCQGKNISDESSVSPKKTTYTVPTIPPARIPRHGDWRTLFFPIVILMLLFVTAVIMYILKNIIKVRRGHQHSGDIVNGKSIASKDTKDVNCKNRAKKNNPGKERTELQLSTRQQSYQVKQGTSKTSSLDVVIETEHQDSNKGFVRSRDLDAENVVYNENVDISTIVVPSLYGNGSLSDLRQNNFGKERAEFHPCARKLSYQTNQETSQRSLTDVTTEDEDQDNIENMIVWKGPRIRISHASYSSSDSDRSQTPMLKEISTTKRQQPIRHHSNLPLSPQTLPKQVRMDLTCRISDSTTSRLYSDV